MVVSWYLFVLLAATLPRIATSKETEMLTVEKSNGCGRVWVTVNSLEITISLGNKVWDPIELNWDYTGCSYLPTLIGLFDSKPKVWMNALDTFQCRSDEGYIITNETLGRIPITSRLEIKTGLKGPHCLWPWVAAGDDAQIFAYNCLKIQPTWMEDNIDEIGNIPIGKLVLPGTHNSGAWGFNSEVSTIARDRFVLCQDRSVWAQLIHGIRFLDIRVGYYDYYEKEVDRYWVNFNLIRIRPLQPLLKKINAFLSSTLEVVFLDIHHLTTGFYEPDGSAVRKVHLGLLELMHRELEAHLADAREFNTAPGTSGPTLQTFIKTDKRLLLSYVDKDAIPEHNWLWPSVPHLWINTNNPVKVLTYLDKAVTNSPSPNAESPVYAAIVHTTPTIEDVLFHGSVRASADEVNRNTTKLLETTWRKKANIVATDFFLGNDVIDVAISLCTQRGDEIR